MVCLYQPCRSGKSPAGMAFSDKWRHFIAAQKTRLLTVWYDDTIFGSAKAGLVHLTKTLAIRWVKHNIRVNAVAAGLTESRMSAETIASPAWAGPASARTPRGRLGEQDVR